MQLSRYQTPAGPRWAVDGAFLAPGFGLSQLLQVPAAALPGLVEQARTTQPASGLQLPPIEAGQEVWACGVTYQRSREARKAESAAADVYDRVYEAERPELFYKAAGWRVVGSCQPIRVRCDSAWNVPEPELTLVLNCVGEIVGYCAGNDVSSRSIEGANPLYLPQAKVYDGSCALGPSLVLAGAESLADLAISLEVERDGTVAAQGRTRTSAMKRTLAELAACLFQELSFPQGVFLMTGTGIVPEPDFSLQPGDFVRIRVGELLLENETR